MQNTNTVTLLARTEGVPEIVPLLNTSPLGRKSERNGNDEETEHETSGMGSCILPDIVDSVQVTTGSVINSTHNSVNRFSTS